MCGYCGCNSCGTSCPDPSKGEPGIQGNPGLSSVIAQGEATLVAGTVTVTCQPILSTSLVILSRKTGGGMLGELTYTIVRGVSFTINSDNPLDTSVISYIIV